MSVAAARHRTLFLDEAGAVHNAFSNVLSVGAGATVYDDAVARLDIGIENERVPTSHSNRTDADDSSGSCHNGDDSGCGRDDRVTTTAPEVAAAVVDAAALNPQRVQGIPPMVCVSMTWEHALMVDRNGGVWAWGNGHHGRTGLGHERMATSPVGPLRGGALAVVEVGDSGGVSEDSEVEFAAAAGADAAAAAAAAATGGGEAAKGGTDLVDPVGLGPTVSLSTLRRWGGGEDLVDPVGLGPTVSLSRSRRRGRRRAARVYTSKEHSLVWMSDGSVVGFGRGTGGALPTAAGGESDRLVPVDINALECARCPQDTPLGLAAAVACGSVVAGRFSAASNASAAVCATNGGAAAHPHLTPSMLGGMRPSAAWCIAVAHWCNSGSCSQFNLSFKSSGFFTFFTSIP